VTASAWQYFSKEELMCPCCEQLPMNNAFMTKLSGIRRQMKTPLQVNSGYRCKKYNESIGAKSTSAHVKGRAVDISTANLTEEQQIQLLEEAIRYGLTGIGVNDKGPREGRFIHLDNTRPRLWSY